MTSQQRLYIGLFFHKSFNITADALSLVILPLAFLSSTGSVKLAAVLTISTTVPKMALMLPLGAIADRIPRRPTILFSYFFEILCLITLSAILLKEISSLSIIIFLGLVRGTVSQLSIAAAAGYIPSVLGRSAMLSFNSRTEAVDGIATLGGPSVAGLLIGKIGAPASLLLPAVLSVASAIIVFLMPSGEFSHNSKARPDFKSLYSGLYSDIREGLKTICETEKLRGAFAINGILGLATGSYVLGVIPYIFQSLQFEPIIIGLILGAAGAGGLSASLTVHRVLPLAKSDMVLTASLIISGMVLAIIPLTGSPYLIALLLFILDFFWATAFIYVGTLEQVSSDYDILARVGSINDLVFAFGGVLSAAGAYVLMDTFGPLTYLTSVSLFSVLIGLFLNKIAKCR